MKKFLGRRKQPKSEWNEDAIWTQLSTWWFSGVKNIQFCFFKSYAFIYITYQHTRMSNGGNEIRGGKNIHLYKKWKCVYMEEARRRFVKWIFFSFIQWIAMLQFAMNLFKWLEDFYLDLMLCEEVNKRDTFLLFSSSLFVSFRLLSDENDDKMKVLEKEEIILRFNV